MKNKKLNFIILFLTILLFGCVQPILEPEEVRKEHKILSRNLLNESQEVQKRNLSGFQMYQTVDRILPKIRKASFEVCLNLELEECELMHRINVNIVPWNPEINAFANQDDEIYIYGGLINSLETDAEIASVIAHEFVHVMFSHVETKINNALLGGLLVGGLAAIYSDNNGVYDPQVVEDAQNLGMEVGSLVYSKEMEIEADRVSVYILVLAGYSPYAAANTIVKINNFTPKNIFGPSIALFDTHPPSVDRVAHLLKSIENARAGIPLQLRK